MMLATGWCIARRSEARERRVEARERDVGLYGTGVLFEEPNPTGSRPRDLQGLMREKGGFYRFKIAY